MAEKIIQIIKNILSPDNSLRQQNEQQLNSIKQSEPNGLITTMINLLKPKHLSEQSQQDVRHFCAFYLRKNLSTFQDQNQNSIFHKLQPQTKSLLKSQLFNAVEAEQILSVRNLLCECIGEIGATMISLRESWPELIPQIFNLINSSNHQKVEIGLRCLSSLYPYATQEFTNSHQNLSQILNKHMQNQFLYVSSVSLFSNIIQSAQRKELDHYQALIPILLNIVRSQNYFTEILSFMQDMVDAEPKFFKPSFEEILDLMKNIVFEKKIESGIKKQATEIIIGLAERIPALIKNQETRLKVLLEIIFYNMIDIDEEISRYWEKPPEGFNEQAQDSNDDAIQFGIQSIDRLIASIGEKIMLPNLSSFVQQMFSVQDWRYKQAAIMVLSQVGEYINDISEVAPIVKVVLHYNQDSNPKIRYSICHCIGQISKDMKPDFQELYQEKVMECIGELLYDPVPRVQSHAIACLSNFFEGMNQCSLQKYTKTIMQIFQKLLNNSISIVKENLVQAIGCLSEAIQEDFVPYYDQVVKTLMIMVENHRTSEYRELRGKIIETLATMACAVEWQHFQKYANKTIELYLTIQNSNLEETDPQKSYLLSSWEKLCQVMQEHISPYLPTILPSVFNLIKKIFQINQTQIISSQTETSETEEGEISIRMLSAFIETNDKHYFPYIEQTLQILFPLITFNINDEIRKSAISCFTQLIKVASSQDKQAAKQLAIQIMQVLWQAIEQESQADVIEAQIYAISDCYYILDEKFMSEQEMNEIQKKIFNVLLESDKRKYENNQQMKENDLEQEEIQNYQNDNEQEDELYIAISELIGMIFKTQKELSLPLANSIFNNLLSKALQQNQTSKINTFALNIVCDMIEHLGLQILQDKFPQLCDVLINFSSNKHWEARQTACQGIGKLAKFHKMYFQEQSQYYIKKVLEALKMPKDSESPKLYQKVKNRIISVLLEIIQNIELNQNDYKDLTKYWLDNLPMKHDKDEAIYNHLWLAQVTSENPEKIILDDESRIKQILKIFGEILETKYSNKEIKQKIKESLKRFQQNSYIQSHWAEIKESLNQNQRNRLEACLN